MGKKLSKEIINRTRLKNTFQIDELTLIEKHVIIKETTFLVFLERKRKGFYVNVNTKVLTEKRVLL